MFVAGACVLSLLLSEPSVSPHKWFSTDQSGSYGDDLPSRCVSAPCGTKEFLLVCPALCLGVEHWISRIGRLRRGLLFT